jgi:hypothetical protein
VDYFSLVCPFACGDARAITIRALNFLNGIAGKPLFGLAGSLAIALLGAKSSLGASGVSEYQVGEIAQSNIVTAVALVVIDPAQTEALRQKEQERVAAVFRYDPRAAASAEADLRSAVTNARNTLLLGLRRTFGRSVLDAPQLRTPEFRRVMVEFEESQPEFPLSTELAQLWALGASGALIPARWSEWLQSAMSRPLVNAEALPAAAKIGPVELCVTASQPSDGLIDQGQVEQNYLELSRTNLVMLSAAQKDAWQTFPEADARTAAFLASLLRENCVFDAEFTAKSRSRRIEAIYAADRYEPGAILVEKGQRIDAKVKRALDELWLRTIPVENKALVAESDLPVRSIPPASAIQQQAQPTPSKAPIRWWITAACSAGMATIAMFLVALRRRRTGSVEICPANEVPWLAQNADDTSWRKRALAAERKAEKLSAMMRRRLVPNLAQWLSQHFVGSLLAERVQMIDAQKLAELEVSQLEERLTALRAPLGDRLKAYEKRITELEQQLAAKDQENRELIQAKIQMTHKQLQAERASQPLSWN